MANDTKGIFISYRRDETAGYAGRLEDRFNEHFGEHNVFRDIDSIEPGLDFTEVIKRAVDSTEVMLAVIGKNWLTATDAAGRKRLENPDDYVRIEIATALKRNTRVIPLLVQGAAMPSAEELPEDLAPLARRNAFELHDSSWNEEVSRLISTLEKVLEHGPVEEGRQQRQPETRPQPESRNRMQGRPLSVTVAIVLLALLSLLSLATASFFDPAFEDRFYLFLWLGIGGLIAAAGLWMLKRR